MDSIFHRAELADSLTSSAEPDVHLPTIAATLRASAVDVELTKLDKLGALANALFSRLVADEQTDSMGTRGLFGTDVLEALSEELGRAVTSDDINSALKAMTAENLVMRLGHGRYGIADPVVRELSRKRSEMLRAIQYSVGSESE